MAEACADGALTTCTAFVRQNNVRETTRSVIGLQLGALPLYIPVLAVLAYSYEHVSPLLVLFFFVPALAAQRLFLLYQEQRNLAEGLATFVHYVLPRRWTRFSVARDNIRWAFGDRYDEEKIERMVYRMWVSLFRAIQRLWRSTRATLPRGWA